MNRILRALIISAMASLLSIIQPQAAEICGACHQDVISASHGSVHAALTCDSCHADSAEHARRPRQVAPGLSFGTDAETAAGAESCLACHQAAGSHWLASSHSREGLSCASCHETHTGQRRSAESDQATCLSCHADVRASLNMPSRHPVREGITKCVDCHEPHGTMNPADLLEVTLNESCLSCHESLRGPHLFEHQPVTEDCSLCHKPHGSVHASLLQTRGPLLCQQCHMANFHPSSPLGGSGLSGGAAAASLLGRNCLNCHPKVHGSNHPSGARLSR